MNGKYFADILKQVGEDLEESKPGSHKFSQIFAFSGAKFPVLIICTHFLAIKLG